MMVRRGAEGSCVCLTPLPPRESSVSGLSHVARRANLGEPRTHDRAGAPRTRSHDAAGATRTEPLSAGHPPTRPRTRQRAAARNVPRLRTPGSLGTSVATSGDSGKLQCDLPSHATHHAPLLFKFCAVCIGKYYHSEAA